MTSVADNLEIIREHIARAAERAGRSSRDVTLVAVTKTVAPTVIMEAIAAGVRHFGENRVQEAAAKFAELEAGIESDATLNREGKVPRTGVTLHMIGGLQRNKARQAANLFSYIHSVDRMELAQALDRAVGDGQRASPLRVLLEVNLTGESSKGGVSPSDLPRLADALAACRHLQGSGLMTIARIGAEEAELRRTFSTLRDLLYSLRTTHPGDWQSLSMGMSNDYEYAVEEGATMVRVGRALFGERLR